MGYEEILAIYLLAQPVQDPAHYLEALLGAPMTEITLTIPIEPPSGNHYKSFRVIGKHASWYLTKEAKAWHLTVALKALGRQIVGKAHEITYTVYQGSGSRGDVDNYAKVILDGLVKAGVLKSDASVVAMHAFKVRDRNNPRTEITVRAI